MHIKKLQGIRESVGENEIMLFNTYTYERIKLNGSAFELWNRMSKNIALSLDSNEYDQFKNIISFLVRNKYLEVQP